jgi:hypothetical protein
LKRKAAIEDRHEPRAKKNLEKTKLILKDLHLHPELKIVDDMLKIRGD